MKKIKKLLLFVVSVVAVMAVFSFACSAEGEECADHSTYHDYIDGAWYELCLDCDYKVCWCQGNCDYDYSYGEDYTYKVCRNCGTKTLYCDHSEYDYCGNTRYYYCSVDERCNCGEAVISGTKHQYVYTPYSSDSWSKGKLTCELCSFSNDLIYLQYAGTNLFDNGDGTYSGEWVVYDWATGNISGSGEMTVDEKGVFTVTGEGEAELDTICEIISDFEHKTVIEECENCYYYEYEWDEETESEVRVKKAGYHSVNLWDRIEKIVIGEGITKVTGAEGTSYVYEVKEVVLPESLEELYDFFFVNATLNLPENCRMLSETNDGYAEGLCLVAEVIISENSPYYSVDSEGNIYNKDKTVIHRFVSSASEFEIPETVVEIGFGAFAYNDTLERITIGSNVKAIGGFAFAGCIALENITIDEGVETIGEKAFVGVAAKEIEIPATVTELGESAFSACLHLERLTIPASVETVGRYLLSGTINLKELYVYSDGLDFSKSYLGEIYVSEGYDIEEITEIYDKMLQFELRYICGNLDGYDEENKEKYGCYVNYADCQLEQFREQLEEMELEEAISSVLTVYCNEGSMAEAYAKEKGIKYVTGACVHEYSEWVTVDGGKTKHKVCIKCGKVVTDDGSADITVEGSEDNNVVVKIIEDNGNAEYIFIEGSVKGNIVSAYDINLVDENGNKVQPEGTVKVCLPVSEDIVYFKVYRINDDGSVTDMKAVRKGEYLVFETDHFSYYVIVGGTTQEDAGYSNECDCVCHKHPLLEILFALLKLLTSILGGSTEMFCNC